MPNPSPKAVRAGIALGVVAIAAGIALSRIQPEVADDGRDIQVAWDDGGAPADAWCLDYEVNATAAAVKFHGGKSRAERMDGGIGHQNAFVRVCGAPSDIESPALPDGVAVIRAVGEPYAYQPGQPRMHIYLDGALGNPSLCACGTGCRWRLGSDAGWNAGVSGRVYAPPYEWEVVNAATCIKTTCVALSGFDSLPPECM